MGKQKRQTKGVIQVYTDGSYDWGRKVGGYGAVIFMDFKGENRMRKLSSTSSYVDTTSNRMEARAILAVLKRIKPGYNIDIYSDSEYCVKILKAQLLNYRYMPTANQDLWKKIGGQIKYHKQEGSYIKVAWVRSHAGNPFNEMADRLADQGSRRDHKKVCDQKYHEKQEKKKLRTIRQ